MSCEQQYEEMERGFLGEKSYEFGIRCNSSNVKCKENSHQDISMHLKLDMHHLGLTKQAQYVGMRNLKHLNSKISFVDNKQSRKISLTIAPYAKTDCEISVKQNIKLTQNTQGNIILSVLNDTPIETRDNRNIRFSIEGQIKSAYANGKIGIDCDDTGTNSGIHGAFNVGNYKYNKKRHQDGQIEDNIIIDQKSYYLKWLPSSVELSGQAAKRNNNTGLTWSFSGLAVSGKIQGIVQVDLENIALKRMIYMLRYNSSLWLRICDSSDSNTKGISSVYEYAFNESIKLRNYINSSYTVATQLEYKPTQFLTLLYSANVNIHKFLNDVEDYKVGYGIYIHA